MTSTSTGTLARLAVAAVATAAAAIAAPAAAVPQIRIVGIEAAAGSDYTPPARLGLKTSTPGGSDDVHAINRADCLKIQAAAKPSIKVNWHWTASYLSTTVFSGVVKVSARGSSCSETSLQKTDSETGCVVSPEVTYKIGATYSAEIDLRDLVGRATTCDEGGEQDAYIYFVVNDVASTGMAQQVYTAKSRVRVDLSGPVAPTLQTVTAGGGNLHVTWKHADDSAVSGSYVYWSDLPIDATAVALGGSKVKKSDLITAKTYQITGLTNGKEYRVAVTAVDANDNESGFSTEGKGTPIETVDLWQYYKAANGTEEGGFAVCSATRGGRIGGWAALLALVVALLAARRRGRAGLVAVALCAGALSLPASALAASPIDNALDFRTGSYLPAIDGPFTGKTKPYATLFDGAAWEFGLNADFRLWDRFGSLSLGVGAGWWTKEGKAVVKATGESATDKTTFKIVPLSLDLTYRLDPLWVRGGVPFVPYVRAGLLYGVWWILDGTDAIATWKGKDGVKREALGGTAGVHAAAGMRFVLDILEPAAARSFDIEMGVNHSYLFVEYDWRNMNDFGSAKSFDLSDAIVSFGLGFDL